MEEEKRKPIKIVCPHCGRTTTVVCRETRSGWIDGLIYDIEDSDMEVFNAYDNYVGWEYRCYTCDADLEYEELEELTKPPIPITEQLKMEGGIDLFEDFWAKDQAQSKKGEEE
jgi:hypothetical protein